VVASFLNSQGYLPETVGSLVTTSEGRSAHTGITHLRFAQEVEGLAVYGTYVKAAVNDDGEIVHLIENWATPPAAGLLPTALGERAALDAALEEVHPGVSVTLTPGPRAGNTQQFSGDDFFYQDPSVTRVAIPMRSGVLQEGYLVETWSDADSLLHHTLIGGGGCSGNGKKPNCPPLGAAAETRSRARSGVCAVSLVDWGFQSDSNQLNFLVVANSM